ISSQVQPGALPFEPEAPAGAPERSAGPWSPAMPRPRPRVWPAAIILALEWIAIETPRLLEMQAFVKFMILLMAPMAAAVLLAAWWLFFSRLRWRDRLLGLGVVAGGGAASALLAPYPYMAFLMLALPW